MSLERPTRRPLSSFVRLSAVAVTTAVVALVAFFVVFRQPSLGSVPYPIDESSSEGQSTARADPERLRAMVEHLTTELAPRDVDHPDTLDRAADWIEQRLGSTGADVTRTSYVDERHEQVFHNLSIRVGPESNEPLLVVGAHYDAYGIEVVNPGADDNASGTAGLLELARLLSAHPPPGPVELVAFSTEEPPYFATRWMGSAVHARALAERGVPVHGMVCLEMIGYFSDHQPWPTPVYDFLYPDRGDFIALVGRWNDRHLVRTMKRAFRGAGTLPAYSFTTPVEFPGLDASDHRSYWRHGWPAVLVTDTAFLRNARYHTRHDTWWTLDYERMAAVVDGVFASIHHLTR